MQVKPSTNDNFTGGWNFQNHKLVYDRKLIFSIRKNDIAILDLNGKVIGSRALHLKDELLRLKKDGVSSALLNFQNVTSIDSLGVFAILSAGKRSYHKNISHEYYLQSIFGQNRAASVIPILGSEEEALGNTTKTVSMSKDMRNTSESYKYSCRNLSRQPTTAGRSSKYK